MALTNMHDLGCLLLVLGQKELIVTSLPHDSFLLGSNRGFCFSSCHDKTRKSEKSCGRLMPVDEGN